MVMSAQVLSLLQPGAIPFDHEELYNAAHARLIQLEHASRWLDLQYRGHCGGCTQHALLGAGLFRLLGHSLFVWKLIPVFYIGVMTFFGARYLRREVGLAAAVFLGLLLTFPSPTFLELSLTAWGNHFESGVAAVVVLATAGRFLRQPAMISGLALGVTTAWAMWIGFSSTFVLVALSILLWRRINLSQGFAFTVGLSLLGLIWTLQIQTAPSTPFETIYYSGESLPSLTRIPEKLWSLFAPRQLIALYGSTDGPLGYTLGILTASVFMASAWLGRRSDAARPVIIFLFAFLAVYSTVRFTVWAPPAPDFASPGSLRYAAPIFGLLSVLLAAVTGKMWRDQRRLLAVALLTPALTVGLFARASHFTSPFPDRTIFSMAAPDFEYSRDQAGYILSLKEHKDCLTKDPQAQRFHAFAIGWHEARDALDKDPHAALSWPSVSHSAAFEGFGAALISQVDGDESQGPRSLNIMLPLISNLQPKAQVEVLTAAAKKRPWLNTTGDAHTEETVARFSRQSATQPDVIQIALTRSLGYRWGGDLARWRTPRKITIPSLSALSHPDAFVMGLAEAIGERWGTGPWDVGPISSTEESAWTAGLQLGADRQWIKQTR